MPFPVKKGNSRVRRGSPVASPKSKEEKQSEAEIRKTIKPPRRSKQTSSYYNATSECETKLKASSELLPTCKSNGIVNSQVVPVVKLNKTQKLCSKLNKTRCSSKEITGKDPKVKNCNAISKPVTLKQISTLPKQLLKYRNDVKLSSSCCVLITCEERMKAEIAIMKLRKGQKNEDFSERVSKADLEESDLSSSTSEYDDSQSDDEDDDDDKPFEPSRTYPFRKKSVSPNKSGSSRSFSHAVSSNSSAESSSESLPDLDFPITGSWASTTSTVSTTNSSKPVVSETSSTGLKTRSLSGSNNTSSSNNVSCVNEPKLKQYSVMGSTQSKSNEASSSKKPSPITSRSLRSSDGNHKFSENANCSSDSPTKQHSKYLLETPEKEKSGNRNSTENKTNSKPTCGSAEAEKSYALRCLDKKDTKRPSLPCTSMIVTPQQEDKETHVLSQTASAPAPVVVQKRGRGRPRKYPLVIQSNSTDPATSATPAPASIKVSSPSQGQSGLSNNTKVVEKPGTPLTRSKRRSVIQPENAKLSPKSDKQSAIVKENPRYEDPEKSTPFVRKLVDVGVKRSRARNALAARARQSKIIAKSRVLHSGKRRVESWRGINKTNKSDDSNEDVSDADAYPTMNQEHSKDRKDQETKDSAKYHCNSDWSLNANEVGKAKCDVCKMTFTRRFSLTKHLNTRQHHKKVQLHRLGLTSKNGKIKRLVGRPRLQKNHPPPDLLYRGKLDSIQSIHSNDQHLQLTVHHDFLENNSVYGRDKEELEVDKVENGSDSDDNDENLDLDDDDEDDASSSQEPEAWTSGKVIGRHNFECEVCGENFTNKFQFASHLWNHRQDSNLTCSVCKMAFTSSDAYNVHIDSSHLDTTKYSCSLCPSKFSRIDYLRKHEAFHKLSQSERFRCTICEKRLGSQELLQRHRELRHFIRTNKSNNHNMGKIKKWKTLKAKSRIHPRLPEYITCDEPPTFENSNNDDLDLSMGLYLDGSPVKMKGVCVPRTEENCPKEASYKYDIVPLITPEDYGREIPLETYNPQPRTYSQSQSNTFSFDMDSFGVPSDYSRTISMGCGYKTSVILQKDMKFNSLQCTDCRKLFQNRRSLYNHCKYFTQGERYACHTCKKIFKFKHHLNRHMLRHTMQKDGASKSLIAARKTAFFKHRKLSGTKGTLPKLLLLNSSPTDASDSTIPSTTDVSVPTSSTSTTTLLLKDAQLSNGQSSSADSFKSTCTAAQEENGSPIAVNELVSSVLTKINTSKSWNGKTSYKQHACEICSKTFTEKKTLDVHMYYHQKENLLSCPDCEAKCERKNDLELHFRCHVKRTPFFLCYVCFKPFRWKKDMVRHVRKKHPEERTYRCLYCQDKFRTSEDLACHVADSHPEHRSFPCEVCGRRYAQKRYLILHMQNQHGPGHGSGMVMMMSPGDVLRDEDNDDVMDLGEDFAAEDETIEDTLVPEVHEDDEGVPINQSLDTEHSFSISKIEHQM